MDVQVEIAGPAAPAPATPLDERLAPAYAWLDDPGVRVLSLDVFDTLLFRKVPEPVDAFLLVATRLGEAGLLAEWVPPEVFSRLRQAAEWRAREARRGAGGGLEVTLPEIYAQLPPALFHDAPPDAVAALEVGVEQDLLACDLDVLALVEAARARGKAVIAVSDTYFSEYDARRFLERVPAPLDRVFVSSAHGVGKGTGLFGVVLRALGEEPRAIVHVGDNRDADVAGAGRLGIHAVYFERRPAGLEDTLEREVRQLRAFSPGAPRAMTTLRPADGDFGLAALRTKVLHRAERSGQPAALRPYWDYGATTLGPVLTGFAEWVVERTEPAASSKIFCLMREGALLADLVNVAADHAGARVSAEPIWLSRQVLARATVIEGTTDELRGLFIRRRLPTLRQFCRTLALEPADLGPDLARRADARLDDAGLGTAAVDRIASDSELRARVVATAQATRRRVVRYVRSLLPPGERRLVLVDLGWGATIQSMLDRVLRHEGVDVETSGLYLITQDVAVERLLNGTSVQGFLGQGGLPSPVVPAFMRSPELLEQVCMPDHGSQVDLTDDLEPVLADDDAFVVQAVERHAVQQGVRAFQRHWERYAAALPELGRLSHAPDLLLAILARAVLAPSGEEAAVFSGWLHDENYGSEGVESIVAGHAARAVPYLDPRGLVDLPMTSVYWPYALAAVHDERLAEATAYAASGAVPYDLFSAPLDTGDVELYVDIGWGFGASGSARVPARRNLHGLTLARAELRADFIKRIRFDPASKPAIVRLDWIALRCWRHDRAEPVALRIESDEEFAGLGLHGCRALAPRLLLARGNDPQVVLDLAGRVDGQVWKVEVEIAFAVLGLWPSQARVRYEAARRQVTDLAKRSPLVGRPLGLARRAARRLR